MADVPDPSTMKRCPQCGHANRPTAKICTHCGYAFPVEAPLPAAPTAHESLKRCPDCGTANRISAKVCIHCGHQFSTAPEALGSSSRGKKWCPECGTVCHLDAKVCPHCGHHFHTDFTKAAPAVASPSPNPTAAMPPAPILTEAPIIQPLAEGVTLPPVYDPPPPLPILPDPSVVPTISAPDPAAASAPAPENADTTGGAEPAPDLSDVDFDALRRTAPDHLDQRGRVMLSLFNKKDR